MAITKPELEIIKAVIEQETIFITMNWFVELQEYLDNHGLEYTIEGNIIRLVWSNSLRDHLIKSLSQAINQINFENALNRHSTKAT